MFSDILGYQQEFSEDTALSSRRLRKRDKVKRMIRRVSVTAVCVCVCVCVLMLQWWYKYLYSTQVLRNYVDKRRVMVV